MQCKECPLTYLRTYEYVLQGHHFSLHWIPIGISPATLSILEWALLRINCIALMYFARAPVLIVPVDLLSFRKTVWVLRYRWISMHVRSGFNRVTICLQNGRTSELISMFVSIYDPSDSLHYFTGFHLLEEVLHNGIDIHKFHSC